METRTYTVYKFDELSESAQEKAVQNLYDINVDFEWWNFICEDAKNIGLDIVEFDLDRSRHVYGRLTTTVDESASAILKDHGDACDTYKLAKQYKGLSVDDEDYEEKEKEYEYALCEEYASILQKEYEYLTSKEVIIETIKANDYNFTEDGKLA